MTGEDVNVNERNRGDERLTRFDVKKRNARGWIVEKDGNSFVEDGGNM